MNRKNWNLSTRRVNRNRQPNGFTLMELLIVMAIILILMLLAIPTVGALRKNGNRLSAIKSIQAIQTAESMYAQNYPANGYACSLSALGGDTGAGAPSATAAQFLKADITSGFKDGYVFAITNCTKVNVGGTDRITSYTITAVPQTIGKTGDSGYCGDDNGIKYDPTGGTNCTQMLQ
ncbi:MAG: prepilin-type N-terminal cleavage/methylation domain-containing protein [Terracidiphilus sp.]